MKNRLIYILLVMVLVLVFTSCKKDFLDTKSLTTVPSSDTWKDGPLSEAFVTNLYAGLGQGGFDEQMYLHMPDEELIPSMKEL